MTLLAAMPAKAAQTKTSLRFAARRHARKARRVRTEHAEGWGECVADVEPGFSEEFNDGAWLVMRTFLAPALFEAGDLEPSDLEVEEGAVLEELAALVVERLAGAVALLDRCEEGAEDRLVSGRRVALPLGERLDRSAQRRPGFVEDDLVTCVDEPERSREPGEAAADD